MNEHNLPESETSHSDSHLDAFAAVALIFIAVISAVIWVSSR